MKKRFWLGASSLVTYSAFIFYLSSIPSSEMPSFLSVSDKTAHLIVYMGLGLVFNYFLSNLKIDLSQGMTIFTTILFVAFYGLADEIHQTHTPGRSFDLTDVAADTIGGICGHFVFRAILLALGIPAFKKNG